MRSMLEGALDHFDHSPNYGDRKLKRKDWTRKEALGHLIDMATAHRLWTARALAEAKVTAAGYPGEDWVALEQYGTCSWASLIDHWQSLNLLLIHVLNVFPEERVNTPVRIGFDDAVPLRAVLERYVEHSKD